MRTCNECGQEIPNKARRYQDDVTKLFYCNDCVMEKEISHYEYWVGSNSFLGTSNDVTFFDEYDPDDYRGDSK